MSDFGKIPDAVEPHLTLIFPISRVKAIITVYCGCSAAVVGDK